VRRGVDILAVDQDGAVSALDAGEGAEQAGLATTVGTDQRDQLTGPYLQIGRLEAAGNRDAGGDK
jgi:hypothetical protein